MLTILVALISLSILIIVHELGHMFAAKWMGVKVEKFSLGFGKRLFGIKKGGTEYAISVFPFGGYVKLAGFDRPEYTGAPDEYLSKSALKRFFIIVAGSLTNYIFAFMLFVVIFMIGTPVQTTKVGRVLPDFPAAESGLKENDKIVAIDGKPVKEWQELVSIVEKKTGGNDIKIKLERDGAVKSFSLTPKVIKGKNIFGQETSVGKLGIESKQEVVFVNHPFFEAIKLGAVKLGRFTVMTYKGLWLILTGSVPFKEAAVGPVGIMVIMGRAAMAGLVIVLVTMAYISAALAIFNLLPVPVLDGGHVLFLAIEKLRRKPVSYKAQEIISQVMLYLLIALVIFASWNDIQRFFLK